MTRISTYTILAFALVLLSSNPSLAQQGAPPYTTNNAQSACVQFGSCSTAEGNVITATQNAPVTAPAGTPALATYTTLDSAFISSLAAAGASSAFNAQGGGGATQAAPLTVTSTVRRGGSGATNSASNSGTSGSGSGSSGGGSSMGLSGLGSSNAGANVVEVKGALVQLVAVSAAALLGAAILL